MSKRLSDEDVERIADVVARKTQLPGFHPVWIDPRYYQPNYPGWWWNDKVTSSASTNG